MFRGTLVSLPMYMQRPQAVAEFWLGLRRHLAAVGVPDLPASLAAPGDLMAHWTSPALLMSQTCGWPLTHALRGTVGYVGTPTYSAPGCEGANYRSLIVVREEDPARELTDLRGRIAAYNSEDSQSGYNIFRATIAPFAKDGRFFSRTLATGSHAASMQAVLDGEADAACVDCISFTLLGHADPRSVAGLRVMAQTQSAPGLPIITAGDAGADDVARLRAAWRAAMSDPAIKEARAVLFLTGFEVLDLAAYEIIPGMCREAEAKGYPRLA